MACRPGPCSEAIAQLQAQIDAALERARKADAGGNGEACNQALREARRLYGLD